MNPHDTFTTFDQYLTYWGEQRPDGLAIVEGDRRTTYAEADRLSRQLIAFLQEMICPSSSSTLETALFFV